MYRSTITAITIVAAVGMSANSAAATLPPERAKLTTQDICVSAEAGSMNRSWCKSRVRARVRRRPSATAPRVRGPQVRPGRVRPARVQVRREPNGVRVTWTRPAAERPGVTAPSAQGGGADPGEYDVDSGIR